MRKIIKRAGMLLLSATMMFGVAACEKSAEEVERVIYEHEGPGEGETEEPIVISNEYLEMTFDPATTAFDILVKSTGQTWHSCATNPDSDTVATADFKKTMASMLVMEYSSIAGDTKTYNTQLNSVENKYYEVVEGEDGKSITVNYTIGVLKKQYIVPLVANEEEMNVYLDQIGSGSERRKVTNLYRLYDINKLQKSDNKEELLAKYPKLAEEKLYILRDGQPDYQLKNLEETFAALGFTPEDYNKQAEEYGISVDSGDKPLFNASIKYTLDGDTLLVEVPMKSLISPLDYPMTRLKILPYFGCGSSKDEGYMFVPAGSGALINFNNGKTQQNNFFSYMYGWDVAQTRTYVVNDNKCVLPVFGISNNGNSYICVLESGQSYAAIEADINRGVTNTRNYVCANYQITHSEKLDVQGKSNGTMYMYEETLPDEVISQRYIFCKEDGYVNMADTYRGYLQDKYPEYMKKQTNAEVPMTVDILGSIEVLKQIAGIPTKTPVALTTYKEAAALIEDMANNKWNNLNVRYQGWFNGGIENAAATEIRLIGALGGKSSLKKVISTAQEKGYDIYLDGEVQYVYANKLFDGYSKNGDTAKLVNREYVKLYEFSPVWYGQDKEKDYYWLARPSVTEKMMQTLADYASKVGTNSYSFGSIGNILGADYNVKHPVSREATLSIQSEKIKSMVDGGSKVLVDGGNLLPSIYADVLVNIPVQTEKQNILDQAIPFYGMVFHGTKQLMGKAINLASDYSYNLLASIENGCGLYFVFMDETTRTLQETDYTRYYGADYSKWKKEAGDLYRRFQNDLGSTYTQYIVDHQNVADGVNFIEYEDGTRVYVNYNSYSETVDGVTIPATGFIVKKGGN
ncbi:MAG: hypothetical protein J5757_04950 [Lachnospiraceae bacterium]|nr:hypothetical protein [Lachnospiraceae bacterium]